MIKKEVFQNRLISFDSMRQRLIDEAFNVKGKPKNRFIVFHRPVPGKHSCEFRPDGSHGCWCNPHIIDVFDPRTSTEIVMDMLTKELLC